MIMYWPDTPHHLHLSAGRIIMTFFVRMTLILLIVAGLLSEQVDCYSLLQRRNSCSSRREALSQVCKRAYPILAGVVPFIPNVVHAKEAPEVSQDISMVTEATDALSVLVENWERATVDCTYADVPRELLEAKNKEKLLEKASEFALFDKSTSVVSCKRTNRVVRDYIGATGKGPLVNLEKRLLKKSVVELVDPDSLDDYIAAVETFSQEMAKANSLSYTAGVSDFDSVNNFAKGEANINESNSNLDQAKNAIEEANKALKIASSLIIIS